MVVRKSIQFSLAIIKYTEALEQNRKYVIANQLLRSGTSIGANIHEAQHAESKADFIHKMKIALKEANETRYWLSLCELSDTYRSGNDLKLDLEELNSDFIQDHYNIKTTLIPHFHISTFSNY